MRIEWRDGVTEYKGVRIFQEGAYFVVNLRDSMNLPTNRDRAFTSWTEVRNFIDATGAKA